MVLKRAEWSRQVKCHWHAGIPSLMLPGEWFSNLFWTVAPNKKYVLHHRPGHTCVGVCVCGVYTNETVFPWSNSSGVCLLCPDTCCASRVGWGSFTYFLKAALLRSRSHTIRFFHLKRTIRWFLVIYGIVQPLPHPILGRFYHLEKNLCTIKLSPPLPHPVFPRSNQWPPFCLQV